MHAILDTESCVNDIVTPVSSPADSRIEELINGILALDLSSKRNILYSLVQDLVSNDPEWDRVVYHADRTPFVFLVPPEVKARLDCPPEVIEEFQRQIPMGNDSAHP